MDFYLVFYRRGPGSIILHACTYGDGTWMDVGPDEAPVVGVENFAILVVD